MRDFAGLSHNLHLERGKFKFTKNEDKVKSNIGFMLVLADSYRVYNQEYILKFEQLAQKPINELLGNKTLILGNLATKFRKFLPYVKVTNLNIEKTGLMKVGILVEYAITLPNREATNEFAAVFI